jgi:hypothetical protein
MFQSSLLAPDLLVRLFRGEDDGLSANQRKELLELDSHLDHVKEACERHSISFDKLIEWCWKQWSDDPYNAPPVRWANPNDLSRHDLARKLWKRLPADLAHTKFSDQIGRLTPCCLEVLPPAAWREWSGALVDDEESWRRLEGGVHWKLIPMDVALDLARSGRIGPFQHDARAALWSRWPSELLSLIDELSKKTAITYPRYPDGSVTPLHQLVNCAPDAAMPAILSKVKDWLDQPGAFPGINQKLVESWLMGVVRQHQDGWRLAWPMLIRITEQRRKTEARE